MMVRWPTREVVGAIALLVIAICIVLAVAWTDCGDLR